jgi:hypothetical protein
VRSFHICASCAHTKKQKKSERRKERKKKERRGESVSIAAYFVHLCCCPR